jgi:outer membrane receptor protein involved in Fe transport
MAHDIARKLRSAMALVIGAGLSVSALAQEQDQAPKKDEAEDLQYVTVTGSRIQRAGFDTLEPATSISADYIEERGLTNVADALNESPGFGTAVSPDGNQSGFGPGLNFVNRFGLGTNRTLTLINGRRFVSSNAPTNFGPAAPGSQVDLNFVPTILVDTIDNLTVGGAPTYGADAIAGVVNVRLKRDFTGLRLFAQGGERDAGGLQNYSGGVVWGSNFLDDRLNVSASVQYSQVDGLAVDQLSRFSQALSYATNPTAAGAAPGRTPQNDGRVNTSIPFNVNSTDGVPNAVLIRNRRLFTLTFGGLALPTGANNLSTADTRLRCFNAVVGATPAASSSGTCLQFDPSGNLVPYNPGIPFGTIDASGGDGLYLVSTLGGFADGKRTSGVGTVTFDLNDNVKLFADLYAFTSEGTEVVDQTAYNATVFGGLSAPITFPANHPVLTSQAAAALAGQGVNSFRLSRAHRDLQVNNAQGENDLFQVVLGAEGNFEAANRDWKWEVYANYGKNKFEFSTNSINHQRFVNALNVVRNASGQLVCSVSPGYTGTGITGGVVTVGGVGPVADPACVPLDIFGEGRPSAAARAYVSSVESTEAELEQKVFNANITTKLFDIWSGPVDFNIGFERREESGTFSPNFFLRQGLGRSVAISAIDGEYTTKEIFGELGLPLVSEENDVPFVEDLRFTGKFRRVDNTVNGKFTAWTTGLEYRPIKSFKVRGNVTRSLRAPALTELFLPVSNVFGTVGDPCDSRNVNGGTRPATRQANCARFYQEFNIANPATFQSTAVTATVLGTSSGDINLRNESANAWTAGFVFEPENNPNFKLSADWIDIRIDDIITNLTATDLAVACFDNFQYPNEFCSRIVRNPGTAAPADRGQITTFRSGFANGEFQSTAGLAVEVAYRKELADWGLENWGNIEVVGSYYRQREELRSATGVVTTDTEETLGSPTDTVQLNLIYERGPFAARWQANYVSAQLYSRTFTAESRDILEVPDNITHNLSLAYRFFDDKLVTRLAITNVFDEDPPFPIGGDSFGGVYDFLGRRYSLSLTYDLKK